jgi:multidrug transporter EmrE-like cation transporter
MKVIPQIQHWDYGGTMKLALTYILISVVGGGAGQILLKRGMGSMGPLTISADQMGQLLLRMGTNPFVIGGLVVYGLSTVFWLTALSRVDLSFAYPFVSLSYVFMLLASWFLFNEDITWTRLLGTAIVGIGVLLISRSG